jgi:hypothetical protein
MEMINKMKDPSESTAGSRIASVHNGSSLFTGDAVYTPGTLAENEKQILDFCEDSGIALNGRNRKKLFSLDTWTRQLKLVVAAQKLMEVIGPDEWDDYN